MLINYFTFAFFNRGRKQIPIGGDWRYYFCQTMSLQREDRNWNLVGHFFWGGGSNLLNDVTPYKPTLRDVICERTLKTLQSIETKIWTFFIYLTRQRILRRSMAISLENFGSIYVTPLLLFIESLFHRTLWMINKSSISMLKVPIFKLKSILYK